MAAGRKRVRAGKTQDATTGKKGEFRSTPVVKTGLIQGHTFGIKAVQYSVVDGLALFEGDIVLGTAAEMDAQTEELRSVQSGRVERAVIITGAQFRWPNCRVAYDIDPTLPNQNRVTDAIAHWEAHTRFRFVLRTPANAASFPDWVTYRPSSGCSSSVGRQGGQQFVNLGSGCTTGNAIHETGHTVGLWHEQSRQDRDSFVTIHWDKIQAGLEHNFNQHITDGDDVGAYDYGSIMHYPRDAFSIDGSDTITPTTAGAVIGQRTALSAGDIAAANSMCPVVKVIKEGPKDLIADTIKEQIKDVRLDTRKELIVDTIKEQIKDVRFDTRKEAVLDPIKPQGDVIINPGPINPGPLGPGVRPVGPGGALPFAVAAPHQAPGAADPGSAAADAIGQLDAQLQSLAEALADAEAHRSALQAQYDETAALLKRALDGLEPGGRS